MTVDDMKKWIIDRYGVFHYREIPGSMILAAVKVYGSIAFGFGSNPDNAAYDLYCDLSLPVKRQAVEGLVLYPWEIEHRAKADEKFSSA